jgi:hypothetical protein
MDVSITKMCLDTSILAKSIMDRREYVGYRCKCQDGFQGNPYVPNGCQGTIYTLPVICNILTMCSIFGLSLHALAFGLITKQELGQMAHI